MPLLGVAVGVEDADDVARDQCVRRKIDSMPRVPLPDFQCGVVLGEADTVQFPDRVVEDDLAAIGGEHQSGFGAAQIGA